MDVRRRGRGCRPGCRSPSTGRRRSRVAASIEVAGFGDPVVAQVRAVAHAGDEHRHVLRRLEVAEEHRVVLELRPVQQDVRLRCRSASAATVTRSASPSRMAPARSIFTAARLLAARRVSISFPRMQQVTSHPPHQVVTSVTCRAWVSALAILAAVLFALGTVLQQKGTLSTAAGSGRPAVLDPDPAPSRLVGRRRPASPRAGSSRRWRSTVPRSSWCSPSPP